MEMFFGFVSSFISLIISETADLGNIACGIF